MRIDYGGAVIPWYESPLIGAVNYTWQERPPEAPVQDKSSWGQGSGGGGLFGGFFENLDDAVNQAIPGGWATVAAVAVAVATGYVDPTLFATEAGTTALATEGAATLTAAEMATLTEASLAIDTAMAGAGGVGAGASAAGAAGLTAAEIAELTALAPETGTAVEGGINWSTVGQNALQGAGKGVTTNVASSVLSGREITPEGLAISAITGGVGGGAGSIAGQSGGLGLGSVGSGMVSGGAGSAAGAALTGNDIGTAIARGTFSGGIGGASRGLVSDLDPAVKAGAQSVASGLTNALLSGNTNNLLPNLFASGLGSAGATAAWNSLLGDTTQTSDTKKADIDPRLQQLAEALYGPQVGETWKDFFPTAQSVLLMNVTEPITDAQGRTYVPKIESEPEFPYGSKLEDFSPDVDIQDLPSELDPTGSLANQPTSPLSPDSGQQTEAYGYYNTLLSKGVEPALATKMSGYSPSGEPGALPIGSSDGGGGGTTRSVFDGDGEGTRGVPGGDGTGPGGAGILPVVTEPVLPIATDLGGLDIPVQPVLDAGELVVEGERPYVPFEEDFPLQPDEEPEVVKEPVVTKPTGDVIKGTVTSPSTTIKIPGALPTATTPTPTPQASSGAVAPSSGTSQSGGIPTPISGQSLAAAPVYANTQILQQLKQLDPKLLSMVAPHLSGQSGPTGLSALSPQIPQQATGGNMQQSNPYNTLFQTMLADKGGTNPSYGAPMFSSAASMLGYASGGGAKMDDYLTHIKKLRDKEQTGALMSSGLKLLGAPAYNTMGFKDGGHIPEFKTGTTGHYVKGAGDGQSDDIPAMLADGEYVFDADTVASLGNGSSDAGAQLLDHFREAAREHKRSAPVDKIPPKASPLAYMKEALKRHARG